MSTEKTKKLDVEFSKWISTYGTVTIQRVFDLFKFKVNYTEIKDLITNQDSVYYHFLRVPFMNILNGIVIDQVEGYREFVQKMFVDYLMSGAANETNAPVQGETIRAALEGERTKFIATMDEFDVVFFNHNSLISASQKALIKLAKSNFADMNTVTDIDKQELYTVVEGFEEKARVLNATFIGFRGQLQKSIITLQELVATLPNYQADDERISCDKELIDFDTEVGEI